MSLTEKAMLVDLSFRTWGGYKHDKKVSEEVAVNHNSDASMGHYNKQLVPREAFKDIYKVWTAADKDYRTYSLPWLDTGWRILSSVGYFQFMEKVRRHQEEWNKAVDEFVDNYPERIKEAEQRLNGLFDASDYPSVLDIKSRFAFHHRIAPLPDAGDFRVALDKDEIDKVKKEIEATQKDAIQEAMKDVARRIESTVGRMVERLNAFNQGKGVFRDSLVSNINDLVELIPALNISDDQELAAIADSMAKNLCSITPVELRTDDAAREKAVKAANDILAKVSAFAA